MTGHDEQTEVLRRVVQAVLWNASNYPPKVQPHILGQDITGLTDLVVAAVTASGYTDPDVLDVHTREALADALETAAELIYYGQHPESVRQMFTRRAAAIRTNTTEEKI